MKEEKLCPYKQSEHGDLERLCDKHKCRLWVKLVKDRLLVTGKDSRMVDPDAEYIYEGCGLVTAIPWILVNKTKVKKE